MCELSNKNLDLRNRHTLIIEKTGPTCFVTFFCAQHSQHAKPQNNHWKLGFPEIIMELERFFYWVTPKISEGFQLKSPSPKQSMYGIFPYIYHKNQPNVGKYTIRGWYGSQICHGTLKSERKVKENGTVDGWNLANQLRLVVYPVIYDRFIYPRWLFGISEPSTVWTFARYWVCVTMQCQLSATLDGSCSYNQENYTCRRSYNIPHPIRGPKNTLILIDSGKFFYTYLVVMLSHPLARKVTPPHADVVPESIRHPAAFIDLLCFGQDLTQQEVAVFYSQNCRCHTLIPPPPPPIPNHHSIINHQLTSITPFSINIISRVSTGFGPTSDRIWVKDSRSEPYRLLARLQGGHRRTPREIHGVTRVAVAPINGRKQMDTSGYKHPIISGVITLYL